MASYYIKQINVFKSWWRICKLSKMMINTSLEKSIECTCQISAQWSQKASSQFSEFHTHRKNWTNFNPQKKIWVSNNLKMWKIDKIPMGALFCK